LALYIAIAVEDNFLIMLQRLQDMARRILFDYMMRTKNRVQLAEKSFSRIFLLSYWERLFDQKGREIAGWNGSIAFGKKAYKGGEN
jgi:hypothetical protein